MNAAELRSKSEKDLGQDLTGLYEEQFKLRMQMATGQPVKPHRFKQIRREIARVITIVHEKQQGK